MAAVLITQAACLAGVASAQPWGGRLPTFNLRPPALRACSGAPHSAACVNAGVYYLDRARARLHEGAYKLPKNFAKLAPDRQTLILVNLDRLQYHLAPIRGITRALDLAALRTGVRRNADPTPGNRLLSVYTSNWAYGMPNIVLAYESWLYDDGPGSGNLDCARPHSFGCWGHRKNVLWKLHAAGPSAMGAAAGRVSYAMLLVKGASRYHAHYTYTWKQALADGAGSNNYHVGRAHR